MPPYQTARAILLGSPVNTHAAFPCCSTAYLIQMIHHPLVFSFLSLSLSLSLSENTSTDVTINKPCLFSTPRPLIGQSLDSAHCSSLLPPSFYRSLCSAAALFTVCLEKGCEMDNPGVCVCVWGSGLRDSKRVNESVILAA